MQRETTATLVDAPWVLVMRCLVFGWSQSSALALLCHESFRKVDALFELAEPLRQLIERSTAIPANTSARNPKHANYFANSASFRKRTVGSLAKSCSSQPRCPAPKMTSTRSVGESAS